MLTLNQLSLQANFQQFQNSRSSNKQKSNSKYYQFVGSSSKNKQSNQTLLKRCKAIIQEQMTQINTISQQNELVKNDTHLKQQTITKLTQQLKALQHDHHQALIKNQLLHKQLSKHSKTIQSLNQQLNNKNNSIKLLQNKIQLIESSLHKIQKQKLMFQEKCILLEQNMQILTQENRRMQEVIQYKDDEMLRQMNQLRKVNNGLKKRFNKLEDGDEMFMMMPSKRNNNEYEHSLQHKSPPYHSAKKSYKHNYYHQPFYTVAQQPFHSISLQPLNSHINNNNNNNNNNNHYNDNDKQHILMQKSTHDKSLKSSLSTDMFNKIKSFENNENDNINKNKNSNNKHNKHIVGPFSIIDRKLNTRSPPLNMMLGTKRQKSTINNTNISIRNNSISQIRKNGNSLQNNSNTTLTLKSNHNSSLHHNPNPQLLPQHTSTPSKLSSQLSNIKKQILHQYSQFQIKKQKMSHQRINQTLQQIENKLNKLTKISMVDEMESQMEV